VSTGGGHEIGAMAPPARWQGIVAIVATVVIWAAWIVGTRQAMATGQDIGLVGLMRFGVPALIFLPAILKHGMLPGAVPLPVFLLVLVSGAPFFMLVTTGMRFAPAAEIAPLLPGTMPLLVALLAFLVDREPFGRWRVIGFLLVLAGGLAIFGRGLVAATANQIWIGHLCVLSAAFVWASYTIAFRRSRLSAEAGAGIVAAWSAILFLPTGLPALIGALAEGRFLFIAWHALLQGILSGAASIWLYGFGVTRLGPSRAAAFVALTPGLATLLAIPWLGEWPDAVTLAGVVSASIGVLLASEVLVKPPTASR
jgi:drug/metabolite transporter (DMT)-like permease